jgi:hypothetical protein
MVNPNEDYYGWTQETIEVTLHLATIAAAKETDKDKETFPPIFEEKDWTWEQVLDAEFYPD